MNRLVEIHLISDGKQEQERLITLAASVHPLMDYIHLREKHLSARELLSLTERLIGAGIPAGKLIINDRLDVALASGAGGVQLAWHSLPPAAARAAAPGLRLGRSVHSAEEAAEAGEQGADYCLFGHVFATACKQGQQERGLGLLRAAVRSSRIPLIAIGGIEPGNADRIIRQGAAGIAVMSGICSSADPVAAAKAYRAAVQNYSGTAAVNIAESSGGGGEQA
ncbi:thiamine phosphate synthase [Paenibacillus sp. HW567]|uniref:thiamine phosphate synthase n=1 Tax=Paenibacillus sp. HW567 TaxID=1034769 RepID=UPI001E340B52|nr:thiamine phosphate synthase [Paenibacillus sp. HW567]